MANQSLKQRPRTPSSVYEVHPAPVEASLRAWCLAALNASPDGVLSLDRLLDICRGTAAAEGEEDVEPIDLGRIALALAGDADWEVVCRPTRGRAY